MKLLLLALVLAAGIGSVILWRRPDARTVTKAVTSGAWDAGRAQAVTEFQRGYQATRHTYDRTQAALRNRGTRRARTLSFVLEVLGVTVVTAGGGVYGAGKTLAATKRIITEATRGGREAYKAAKVVEVEVIKEVEDTAEPAGDAPVVHETDDPFITANVTCGNCGVAHTLTIPAGENTGMVVCPCGTKIHAVHQVDEIPADPAGQPSPATTENPGITSAPTTEGTEEEMAVAQEATGLTSYANAHTQMANELQQLLNSSQSLVASMFDILAQHSNLVADAAVLQDTLGHATSIAQRIAKNAAAVANA